MPRHGSHHFAFYAHGLQTSWRATACLYPGLPNLRRDMRKPWRQNGALPSLRRGLPTLRDSLRELTRPVIAARRPAVPHILISVSQDGPRTSTLLGNHSASRVAKGHERDTV